MKQRCLALLAILLLLGLASCGMQTPGSNAAKEVAAPTETTETVPETTVPPDGDPNSVTCKGSYTATATNTAAVATMGSKELTNEVLQAYYEMEIASYLASDPEQAPDMDQPLDTQACPIDSTVNSWQQYFLKQALHRWQTVQALICTAEAEEMPIDAAFAPDEELHAECMVNIPAIKFLYGENRFFAPNTMHRAYLDSLSDSLQGAMLQAATDYNYAYMYLTTMGYYLEPTEEETETAPSGESYVDLRHILLLPEDTSSEQSWTNRYRDAERKLNSWKASFRRCEGSFAEIAYAESKEEATYKEGGFYYQVHQGQLTSELDAWCFDTERQAGDTTIIRDGSGIHMLYISRVYSQGQVQAEQSAKEQKLRDFVQKCLDENPIRITYSAIALTSETTALTYDGVLYKDIAHERYPEIPIYLQQDFGNTMYGNYKLRSHGCGITSLAMLSTYMTDTELTPPTLCARYGRYCHSNGTDAMIFKYEPPVLGFCTPKNRPSSPTKPSRPWRTATLWCPPRRRATGPEAATTLYWKASMRMVSRSATPISTTTSVCPLTSRTATPGATSPPRAPPTGSLKKSRPPLPCAPAAATPARPVRPYTPATICASAARRPCCGETFSWHCNSSKP